MKNNLKSLNQLKADGIIPSNIPDTLLINICRSLGIPVHDMDFGLNNDQIERLRDCSTIIVAQRNAKYKNLYSRKYNEYQKLIEKYEKLRDSKTSVLDKDDIIKINKVIGKLKKERDKYRRVSNSITYASEGINFDDLGSKINQKLANLDGKIASKYNTKMIKQYQKVDELRDIKKYTNSKFKKMIISKKMRKINKRIESLKEKQGLYLYSQNKLINKNSEKFIKKMQKKQLVYIREQVSIDRDISKINELRGQIKDIVQNNIDLENNQKNIDLNTISGRIKNSQLERQINKNERLIERLQRKQGYCDRSIQYSLDYIRNIK